MSASGLEEALVFQIKAAGLPEPAREYHFAKTLGRRWRFDFCWLTAWVACEVQGGGWVNGRHTRGAGWENDCEKLASAAALGWRVLPVTARMIDDGRALALIERALRGVP